MGIKNSKIEIKLMHAAAELFVGVCGDGDIEKHQISRKYSANTVVNMGKR